MESVWGKPFTTDAGDPTDIEGGDRVLDSNGIEYIVTAVNGSNVAVNFSIPGVGGPDEPTQLWYAPRANRGSRCPTLQMLVLSEAVE